jgi:antitoxin (DNA-binding transcriptional repressor) of toxin-antitoxin stability system
MTKRAIRISETEAVGNFAGLLARVRAGAEFVIEHDSRAVAVIHSAEPHVRLLSESLRLARERASTATVDEEFARDLENVIKSHREPLNSSAWE